MAKNNKTVVLAGQRPFDCFRLIKRGRMELELRRPTEGARVSDSDKRDLKADIPLRIQSRDIPSVCLLLPWQGSTISNFRLNALSLTYSARPARGTFQGLTGPRINHWNASSATTHVLGCGRLDVVENDYCLELRSPRTICLGHIEHPSERSYVAESNPVDFR